MKRILCLKEFAQDLLRSFEGQFTLDINDFYPQKRVEEACDCTIGSRPKISLNKAPLDHTSTRNAILKQVMGGGFPKTGLEGGLNDGL